MVNVLNVMAYADGQHDLLGMAEKIGVNMNELVPIVQKLLDFDLLGEVKSDFPVGQNPIPLNVER